MYNSFGHNLVKLFNIFRNRPNHLVEFLIENNAFDKNFINKMDKGNKLLGIDVNNINIDFCSFSEMNTFFNGLLEYSNSEILEEELNEQLSEYIKEERYEEAAKIRDVINKKGFNFKL